jgi:hypothetical protein
LGRQLAKKELDLASKVGPHLPDHQLVLRQQVLQDPQALMAYRPAQVNPPAV